MVTINNSEEGSRSWLSIQVSLKEVQIPKLDGLSATEGIHAREGDPVEMWLFDGLIAHVMEDDINQGREAGMTVTSVSRLISRKFGRPY